MKRFEYKLFKFNDPLPVSEKEIEEEVAMVTKRFNDLGNEGWQIIQTSGVASGTMQFSNVWCMRELND